MQFLETDFHMTVCPTLTGNTFLSIQRLMLLVPLHKYIV